MADERDEMHDELIERFAARLRPLPEVDSAAKARVLVAVAAERERDHERARVAHRRRRSVRWGAGAALAAAMAASVVLASRDREAPLLAVASAVSNTPTAKAAATTTRTGGASAVLAGGADRAAVLQTVQLVFRAPAARRVSVVGDFTGWDADHAVMTRDSGSGLWSVTLALPPGRHVYAFLVDDSVWVRDPRAPAAPDADFGRPGSVMLVGRP